MSNATWRPLSGAQAHTALLRQCRAYLEYRGAWTLQIRGGLGQRAGVPDLLALLPPARLLQHQSWGVLVAVECKTGRGRTSGSQDREIAALRASGALCVVVRGVDDLERALCDAGLLAPALLRAAASATVWRHDLHLLREYQAISGDNRSHRIGVAMMQQLPPAEDAEEAKMDLCRVRFTLDLDPDDYERLCREQYRRRRYGVRVSLRAIILEALHRHLDVD